MENRLKRSGQRGWRTTRGRLALLLAALLTVNSTVVFAAENEPVYENPLLNPEANRIMQYTPVEGNIINVLLLGLDRDRQFPSSGGKETHSDSMMVLAINAEQERADLISTPRDMVAYVPGTRGLYKLNGAVNVGGNRAGQPPQSREGLEAARDTMVWVMGGIQIHHVVAVSPGALRAIGDAMGGIEFDMDMSYRGGSGKTYRKGMQHLDGTGIVDYVGARQNASIGRGSDIARTGRQREMLLAIAQKILSDRALLLSLLDAVYSDPDIKDGFFTDMSAADLLRVMLSLFSLFVSGNGKDRGELINSHVFDGRYRSALGGWNFTFIDAQKRVEIIREVYGVTVPELQYTSYAYLAWLHESGFNTVRYLSAAEKLIAHAEENPELFEDDEAAVQALAVFRETWRETRALFAAAAESMDKEETKRMKAVSSQLVKEGDVLGRLMAYPGKKSRVAWRTALMHDNDPLVNEVYVNFR